MRAPQPRDAPIVCEYYTRNEARFAPWDPPRSRDVAEHERWIAARDAEARASGRCTTFLAFEHDRPDVLAAIVTLDGFTQHDPPGAMIAYSVDNSFEGRGIASEAVRRVVRYAFDSLQVHILFAYYHPENARSERLLLRSGFTVVARMPSIPGLEALARPQVLAVIYAAGEHACRETR